MTQDDLTLVDIERKLRQLVNDLAKAQLTLSEARDAEVDAKHVWEAKRRRAVLNVDCPRVGKTESGGRITVDERNAWVESRCEDEEHVYNLAMVKRESAQDHLRTLRDQAMLVMALSKSVQISMGLAGRSEPEWSQR